MKKLFRSEKDSMIAGVCGGIGETYNIDSNIIRLAVCFIAIATVIFPLVGTYIIAWMILPKGRPIE